MIGSNSLEEIALPLALQDTSDTSQEHDVFCQFLQAVYDEFDLDKAIKLVEQMGNQSDNDFLLKNYTFNIKKEAFILIFQAKCKLYRTVEVEEISRLVGSKHSEGVCQDITRHLSEEGYDVEFDQKNISCCVKKNLDSEKILH